MGLNASCAYASWPAASSQSKSKPGDWARTRTARTRPFGWTMSHLAESSSAPSSVNSHEASDSVRTAYGQRSRWPPGELSLRVLSDLDFPLIRPIRAFDQVANFSLCGIMPVVRSHHVVLRRSDEVVVSGAAHSRAMESLWSVAEDLRKSATEE